MSNKGKGNSKGKGASKPLPGTIGAIKAAAFRGTGKRYVQAQAELQYGPQARQLKAEQRASNLQSLRLRKYFPAYLKSLKPLRRQTAKAYNQAASGIASDNAALGDYAAKLQSQLASEGQTSAAARGVGYTPDTSGPQTAIARYRTGNTLGGVVRAQGASQRAYLGDQKRIGKREMIDALQQEANRGRSYNQDLQNLARERGAAAAQAKKELLDSNRQFYLGLKSSETTRRGQNITAADAKRSARVSAASSRRMAASSAASTAATIRGQNISAATSAATRRAENRRARITQRGENRRARITQRGENRRARQSSASSSDVRPALAWFRGAPKGYANQHFGSTSTAVDAALGHNSTWSPADIRKAFRIYKKGSGGGRRGGSQATGGPRPS